MDFAIFSTEGLLYTLRWFHYFFGVLWIGLLYYFNFVQGAFFGEVEAPVKSVCIQKLVPKALWYFRWAAMGTMLTGLTIFAARTHQNPDLLATAWGVGIITGMSIGLVMWFNVWFVIWPNQKIVIQNAIDVAAGKPANPKAADCGVRAGIASRHNVLFSIPMLFFMGAGRHLPISITAERFMPYFAVFFAVLLLLQLNALKGKNGPLTSVKGVVHCGFALAVVLYTAFEILT